MLHPHLSTVAIGLWYRGASALLLLPLITITLFEAAAAPAAKPLLPYDEEFAAYRSAVASDPIAQLQKRIEIGTVKLEADPSFGHLPALLTALNISTASQVLVYSKTSAQRLHISPKNPRAVFFNDRVYVAWIPGAPEIELQAIDPKLGAVFYTLDQSKPARIVRRNECIECHASHRTLDVPGPVVRSVLTGADGEADPLSGTALISHRTPITERWGGWYVTGVSTSAQYRSATNIPAAGKSGVTDLSHHLDAAKYPQPGSDVVALLVLEHQTHMQNHFTRLAYEAAAAGQKPGGFQPPKDTVNQFLRYLLFTDEAALTVKVQGTSDFARWFAEQGPKDKRGRSLHQLDLGTRLLKYPCSPLIYSDTFDQLPREMKQHIYRRLWTILNGEDTSPEFTSIPPQTRQAIREILSETKQDLPAYWQL